MAFNVVVGTAQGLPDSVEVGLAVREPRQVARGGLRNGWQNRHDQSQRVQRVESRQKTQYHVNSFRHVRARLSKGLPRACGRGLHEPD